MGGFLKRKVGHAASIMALLGARLAGRDRAIFNPYERTGEPEPYRGGAPPPKSRRGRLEKRRRLANRKRRRLPAVSYAARFKALP